MTFLIWNKVFRLSVRLVEGLSGGMAAGVACGTFRAPGWRADEDAGASSQTWTEYRKNSPRRETNSTPKKQSSATSRN
jgi:hypothetical protein